MIRIVMGAHNNINFFFACNFLEHGRESLA